MAKKPLKSQSTKKPPIIGLTAQSCGGRKARRIGRAYAYICHAGLIDFAIPIMIKGQYVGAILAGQVTSNDLQDLRRIAPATEGWKDNEELMELYKQVAVMPVEKILAVAQILCDSYNYSVEKQYASKGDKTHAKRYKRQFEELTNLSTTQRHQ